MKLFRKLFLVVPMLFSLASCGGSDSPAGTYTFQLGSSTGTHAGIGLMLTEDPVETSQAENAKRFQLHFDIGTSASNGIFGIVTHLSSVLTYIQSKTEEKADLPESIDDIIKLIDEKSDEDPSGDYTIDGYYYLKDGLNAEGRKETRLMMGFDFNFFDQDMELPPELIEMIMYAVYTGDAVNIIVPVSIQDLLYQLYWYGYRVGGALESPIVYLPDENPMMEAHDIGSHPVEDADQNRHDITKIQNYQKKREEDAAKSKISDYGPLEYIYNTYRDYHTLTMGLAKNGSKK